MLSRQLRATSGLVVAIAALGFGSTFASAVTMTPAQPQAPSYVQAVDCAVGAHIGPAGVCLLGNDQPPPVVVQPAPVVVAPDSDNAAAPPPNGCASSSVTATDTMGNSQTRTNTQC